MVRMPRGGRNWEHLTETREKSKSSWVGEAPSPTRPPLHFTPLSSTLPLIPPLFVVCVGGVHGPTHPELLHVSATAFKVWRKPAWGDGPPATGAPLVSPLTLMPGDPQSHVWANHPFKPYFGRKPSKHAVPYKHRSVSMLLAVFCFFFFFWCKG